MANSTWKVKYYRDELCNNRTIEIVHGRMWADYLDIFTFPFVFLACIVGSILILIITFRRVGCDHKGEWYLTHAIISVIAVSDMLGILCDGGILLPKYYIFVSGQFVEGRSWQLLGTFSKFGKEFCLYLSNCLLICFTVERILSLRASKQRLSLIYLDSVKGGATGTLIGLIVLSAVSPLVYLLDDLIFYAVHVKGVMYNTPPWILAWHTFQFYYEVTFICSTFILIMSTSCLVVALIDRRRTNAKLHKLRMHTPPGLKGGSSCGLSISASANRTLFGCLLLYFLTQSPVVVGNTVQFLSSAPNCVFNIAGIPKQLGETLIIMVARLNFACNFYVYLMIDRKFRSHVRYFFLELFGQVEDLRSRRKKHFLQQLSSTKSSTGSSAPILPSSPITLSPPSSYLSTSRFIFPSLTPEKLKG